MWICKCIPLYNFIYLHVYVHRDKNNFAYVYTCLDIYILKYNVVYLNVLTSLYMHKYISLYTFIYLHVQVNI